MRSVVRQGHPLALYCYEKPDGAPSEVELRDASAIIPKDRIIRYKNNGSVAIFSNWFRYELQRRGLGIWLDSDVYLLAPINLESPNLYGRQCRRTINTAVLRLPPNSPMLDPLISLFRQSVVPHWLPFRARVSASWQLWRSGRVELPQLPWGTTGPQALTAMARTYGVAGDALPPDVFYPVPWQQAAWVVDSSIQLKDIATKRTVGVHLWNECIKHFKHAPAPPGSFLERLHAEGCA